MPDRIIIVGGPRTGKTTLSTTLGIDNVRHTDDLIGEAGWSEASQIVSGWMRAPGPWVVEGVATARALRKFMLRDSEAKPADLVLLRFTPWVTLTPGQLGMGRGVRTVFEALRHELLRRGVEVRA